MKKIGGSFFFGSIFGVAVILFFSFSKGKDPAQLISFPIHIREAYTVACDTRFKIPFWTKEHLTKQSLSKVADRDKMDFFEDEDLFPCHRSSLQDYKGSGFDRGHIVPAADARFNEQALKETFKMSNSCPQNPKFHRGFWARLEKHIRTIANRYDYVDVISGPLFLPVEEAGKKWVKFEVIGENDVAVPTHFFKFVSASKNGQLERWAYVVPNEPIAKDALFEGFLFSIEKLERVSGIVFPR